MRTVWIVDDDSSVRWVLDRALSGDGWQTSCFGSATEALAALADSPAKGQPDLIITDIRMGETDGLTLLSEVGERADIPVIVVTAYSDLDTSVEAFAKGAFEYLAKPFDIDQVCDAAARAVHSASQPEAEAIEDPGSGIIGNSPVMQQLFRQIGKLSLTNVNVLITGETGTGKELLAQAVHRHSRLAAGPFVAINTAAIPGDLLESELFGHQQGAFTGAHKQRIGRFEQADGGTLFLDEIGDMPQSLQSRLLRVLAEGEYYRVGGKTLRHCKVRVIAATHQDLEAAVAAGLFREDLYHRLNVVRLEAPPLRERGRDVALLAEYFIKQGALDAELEPKQLTDGAIERLLQHRWPGNVRELENLCRRLAVLVMGRTVEVSDIENALPRTAGSQEQWVCAVRRWAETELRDRPGDVLGRAQAMLQQQLIEAALDAAADARGQAARLLGCGRNSLTRWLDKTAGKP